mmetsp:Transcript_11916/g.17197  ORF Transcript_11916/g.17197 Transcript_11916/m.17197 type:complete len:291 (-) Transcript_11916:2194-3066(-)
MTTKNSTFSITPVHMACLSLAPYKVLAAVLKEEEDVFNAQDVICDNRTPIEYICWIHQLEIEQALAVSSEEAKMLLNSKRDSNFKIFWNKVELLLKAEFSSLAKKSGKRAKKWFIVHASVTVKKCPIDVLRLALKFYPEQSQIFDEDRKLPLHLALQNGNPDHIQILLNSYPLAASIMDGSGRYPFVIAAMSQCQDVKTLFYLLQFCPEITRFSHNLSTTRSRAADVEKERPSKRHGDYGKNMIQEAKLGRPREVYNDYGSNTILKGIDCKAFDEALMRKKIRCGQTSAY